MPSPVVDLNRAVAVAEVHGPAMAHAALESVADALASYHPFHVARGEFLQQLGRVDEAAAAYDWAIATVGNDAERRFLQQRRAELIGE